MLYYFNFSDGFQGFKSKLQEGVFYLLAKVDDLNKDTEEKPTPYILGYSRYQSFYNNFDGDVTKQPFKDLVHNEVKSTLPKLPNFIFFPMIPKLNLKGLDFLKEKNNAPKGADLNFDYDDKFVYWGFVSNDALKFSVESVDCDWSKNLFFTYNIKSKDGCVFHNCQSYAWDLSKAKMIGAFLNTIKEKINYIYNVHIGTKIFKKPIIGDKGEKIIERINII